MPARDVLGCLRVAQALQAHGLTWMASVRSRTAVSQAMQYYMTKLGIALDHLPPIIHVAGTKGKGSTAAFTESILRHAGLRTGLYTSPHLVSPCERFKIDGKPVDVSLLLRHFWQSWDVLTETEPNIAPAELIAEFRQPGAAAAASSGPVTRSSDATPDCIVKHPALPGFNFLTLVGFKIFCEAAVDVLVLEVGLGGRLDATNVVDRPAVCGITTLDFDHVELLGHTLPEIAAEKAGILKAGVPAVVSPQRGDAMSRLVEAASEAGTPLFRVDPSLLAARNGGVPPELSLSGEFQRTNAALAVALCDIFMHQLRCGRTARSMPADRLENILVRYEGRASDAPSVRHGQRRSSFADSFGASAPPPVGTAVDPPPVYDNMSPLSPATQAALSHTSWPGRSQIVRLDPATRKLCTRSVGTPRPEGQVQLYLDGAHTQSSMMAACTWFWQHSGRPISEPRRACKRILVFNCGTDKDTLQLLLPVSTLPFDSVYFTTVPWLLSPRTPSLSVDQALQAFLARKERMQDAQAIMDIHEGLARAGKRLEDASLGEVARPPGDRLAWQRTLQSLFCGIVPRAEYTVIRSRLHNEITGYPSCRESVDGEHGAAGGTPMPHTPPPSDVLPSIADVLDRVCAEFRSEPSPVDYHVFVTGSLYLVGHTLEVIEFPVA